MEKCIYIALSLLSSLAYSQDYSWEQALFSSGENQPSVIYHMAISSTNEKVIIGKYSGDMTIGEYTIYSSKPVGLFLVKYSDNDSLLWVKTIAESECLTSEYIDVIAGAVVEIDSSGEIYVSISFGDTIVVNSNEYIANYYHGNYRNFTQFKYDSEGDLLYDSMLDGSCSKGIVGWEIDSDKNLYVLGGFGNDVWGTSSSCECIIGNDTITTTDWNAFIIKYNSVGIIEWVHILDSSVQIGNRALEVTNNSIYISGVSHYASDVPFDNYILDFPSSFEYGGYIANFDTTGAFKWAKYFGVKGWASHVQILDLHATSENDIILVGRTFAQDLANALYFENAPTLYGSTYGSDDAFIVCYDSLGNVKWHEMTNSHSDEWYVESTSDSLGNVFVSGTFTGELVLGTDTLVSIGGYEVFIRAFDNGGNHLWAKKSGGTSSDFCYGLEMDSHENLYMVGSTSSNPIHFGENSYTLSSPSFQMFLAKLSKNSIGVEELNSTESFVYPNPNTGTFNIQSEQSVYKLEIYSVLGELVYTQTYSTNTKELQIKQNLQQGAYFVVLSLENGEQSIQKILVN
jgi:hypothetical protein